MHGTHSSDVFTVSNYSPELRSNVTFRTCNKYVPASSTNSEWHYEHSISYSNLYGSQEKPWSHSDMPIPFIFWKK